MSSYAASPTFQDAAAYLSNSSTLSGVSNSIKLELYGLFKYLTVSSSPNVSRPSLFDMTGRAKWDAWSAAGKAYQDNGAQAESRYLEIAKDLGWNEGLTAGSESKPEGKDDSSDDIWDDSGSDSGSSGGGGGGGGGMGVSVSRAMAPPLDDEDASSLHGLTLANNVPAILSYLESHPDFNINGLDQHGYTPLHMACDRGNVQVVELLLSRGADTTIKDPDDYTAAELASIAGHSDVVSIIEKG